jgi:RNA polymerase sigma-70 factor (ECF subfamily)
MPLDNQLVFWGKNDENRDYSLSVCESDGGNPRIFGKAHTAGFMAPTLLGKDLISGSAAEGHNPRTAPAEAAHLAPPVVVSTIPQSGDMHVDPNVGRISVTFDKDMMMDRMWSWCMHSAETFPEISNQKGIKYLADKRTCVLPVKLKPNKTYVIWINTQKNNAFRDTSGHPAIPYLLVFKTH